MYNTYVNLLNAAIGTENRIIPNNLVLPSPLGNVNECILTTGFLLLDAYINLSRNEITEIEIQKIDRSLELALAMQYRMTCIKEALGIVTSADDADMKDTKEMKQHTVQHIPKFIRLCCVPKGFDTAITERNHMPFVKDMVRHSSNRLRLNTIYDEMLRHVHERRIMNSAVAQYEEVFGKVTFNDDEDGNEISHGRANFDKYVTAEDMVYSATFNASDTCILYYNEVDERLTTTVQNGRQDSNRFLNPLATLFDLQTSLFGHSGIPDFIQNFKSHVEGM